MNSHPAFAESLDNVKAGIGKSSSKLRTKTVDHFPQED